MSNYILISSAYRDRILYPNPSDFIVPFQQIQSASQLWDRELVIGNTVTQMDSLDLVKGVNFGCWTITRHGLTPSL